MAGRTGADRVRAGGGGGSCQGVTLCCHHLVFCRRIHSNPRSQYTFNKGEEVGGGSGVCPVLAAKVKTWLSVVD